MTAELASLSRSGFDLDQAILLATASDLVYERNTSFHASWARNKGFHESSSFDRGNTQGFWAYSPEYDGIALIAFRGSSSLGHWVRNAKLAPVDQPWGKVHHGFQGGVDKVEADLQVFDTVVKKAKHIFFTGHSLGGAMALLAAAKQKIKGTSPTIYTFGQPRAGLGNFSAEVDRQLEGRYFRIINQKDIVSRLPPGLIYRHCGIAKRIVRPGQLEAKHNFSENETSITFEEGDLPPLTEDEITDELLEQLDQPDHQEGALIGNWALVKDHGMCEYLRLLKDIRNQNPFLDSHSDGS